MKVSLNVIKRFVDVDLSVDQLVHTINQQLGQVEEVVDLAPKYKDIVIVRVVSCEKHPNADRLSVCMVDDGGVVEGVERDENGLVQVVCGAPNARAGIMAAWLPPKAVVPSSYDDAEPFVLETRDIRGVKSNGMLSAADELALGSDHDGIIEINPNEWKPNDVPIVPGASFAKVFGLDDVIIDIENKMFTHRPDLFGQLGVAREIAGIMGKKFEDPEWYWMIQHFEQASDLPLAVTNDIPGSAPRFMAVALKDVVVAPSPLWLQIELVRLGSKPINNVVDVTNYVMLLTAQPTHAYDYDKLRGHALGVRFAQEGEKAVLLNGKNYELNTVDIVIVDGEGVIGLGGVMGGGNSEVSADTKNIVLEVATFDMYAVRKTSMRHGLFTDAVTRFSKGQSPFQNDRVMKLLMNSIHDTAGGTQASNVTDIDTTIVGGVQNINPEMPVTTTYINERLGLSLSGDEIGTLLRNVHFACYGEDTGNLMIAAPFWRTDIELPEDIIEEVGRLYGFDKLPLELPQRSISPAPENPVFAMKQRVRAALKAAGANEVLTYSFVHENVLTKAGQDAAQAYRLGNAISPDLQYYRLSVLPSLLDKVHPNIKAGHDAFVLFEFGKAHRKGDMDGEELPREYPRLAAVYAAKKSKEAPYYMARRYVEVIAPDARFVPLADFSIDEKYAVFEQLAKPFDPKRAAVIMNGDKFVGVVGELRASVRKAFKLPDATAGFELFQSYLQQQTGKTYTPLSRFPSVTQDISLRVATDISHDKLFNLAQETIMMILPSEVIARVETIGIYQPNDSDTKTITFRIKVTSYERTLTDSEVTGYLDTLTEQTTQKLQAVRI